MNEGQGEKSKRVAKNTLFLFIRMIFVTLVGLYTSRVILDVLGINDFGLYNVVGSIVILFSFLQQALNNATYRYMTYAIGEGDFSKQVETYSMSIKVHLVLAIALFLLAETVGVIMLNNVVTIPPGREIAANIVYQFSVCCFFVKIIKTPLNSAIIAHERMNFFAFTSIIEVVLKLSIVYLLLVFSADKLIVYALLLFILDVVLFIWYYIYCKASFSECLIKKGWNRKLAKEMVTYSGWSVVVNGSDVIVTQSIVLFLNNFCGVVANAALGIANQVTGKVTMLLGSFSQAYNPQIIKSYANGEKSYFQNLLYSTSKISYYLMFLISFPLLLNIDFILGIWLKEVPEGTATFVLFTILYSLVDAYSAPLWTAVHATGNLRTHQLLMSGIKVLNIPLAYIMLKMGYEAWMALAIKFALNVVCSIVRPIYMKRLINLNLISYAKSVFLPMSLVTCLSLPLIYLTLYQEDGFIRLFISIVESIVVIGLFILLFGFNKAEKNLLFEMLHIKKYLLWLKL